MKLLCVAVLLIGHCLAQTVHDAPQPQREVRNFVLSAGFLGAAAYGQIYAEHYGARECVAEDNAAGTIKGFNRSGQYGTKPHDYRVYAIDGGILGAALILELSHHRTAAKRLLILGGAVQSGVAIDTYLQGCT